ncbi:hypothetical protein GCM10011371_05460 [Novosphingobium marinum]|uniref:NifU-like protein involved in Fe-S cluster formation n=1 Tax=Novosphingobium marinum TaxID=1514948 RepID=A0A7Z0BSL5_9SPHN|nr:iron-sulfur cluster assembly scaffold protein [Novosphingobium marinum]NYH94234.1 NifU-like protein involved in Fe-S cluster formation [Novosphingobium marinum]GGC20722.1 hypothetical protein GCM10011371_05460 [Novosphingobium marinum]
MSSAVLYSPEVLGLATRLSEWPWDEAAPLKAQARSKSCGSVIDLGLSVDREGRIERVHVRSHACAIGQSAAAIFASHAQGLNRADVEAALSQIDTWLSGEGNTPDWPGLDAIARARDYPGRHAAILLAWRAAADCLSS